MSCKRKGFREKDVWSMTAILGVLLLRTVPVHITERTPCTGGADNNAWLCDPICATSTICGIANICKNNTPHSVYACVF